MGSRSDNVNVLRRLTVSEIAHAILDMDHLGFDHDNGKQPATLAECHLWDDLADSALLVGGRSRRNLL